jgi:hypothetical protein
MHAPVFNSPKQNANRSRHHSPSERRLGCWIRVHHPLSQRHGAGRHTGQVAQARFKARQGRQRGSRNRRRQVSSQTQTLASLADAKAQSQVSPLSSVSLNAPQKFGAEPCADDVALGAQTVSVRTDLPAGPRAGKWTGRCPQAGTESSARPKVAGTFGRTRSQRQ